ncbi:hypothetical protein GOODEAATRI_028843, partial [Goodea atripinnis]
PAVAPQTSDAVSSSGPVGSKGAPHSEQIYSAIPLQPPNQRNTPLCPPDTNPQSPSRPPTAAALSQGPIGKETTSDPTQVENSKLVTETLTNGKTSPCLSLAESEKSASSQRGTKAEVEGETLEDEVTATTPSPPDIEEDEEDLSRTQRFKDRRTSHRKNTSIRRAVAESSEESLAHRRKRNKEAEKELHHISEKLSHRLEELDLMLKRVLGESDESSEMREEDRQSHCSDSIMEGQRTLRQPTGTPNPESANQTLSTSPSPPQNQRSLHGQLEDAMAEALSLDDERQTNLQVSDHSKRGESHHRPPQRNFNKQLENEAYEEELRRYEERERTKLQRARLKAQRA